MKYRIAAFMNLATLHFHLFAENAFHARAQCFRSIDHHQIAPPQIQPRSTRSSNSCATQ
jgi:hypothetical protein